MTSNNKQMYKEYKIGIFSLSFLMIMCCSFVGCGSEREDPIVEEIELETTEQNSLKYAEGFTITQVDDYKIITINEAWKDVGETYKYVLYKNEKPANISDATFIQIPIKSIACMSLTHVAFLERLEIENSIVGISGCNYVSSPKISARIKNGMIKELGNGKSLNYEIIVDQSPDFVMAYGINASSNGSLNKMKELGLEVVLNSEYMETHPLGMAEWIKFVAAFYDKSEEAEKIFNGIEKEYLSLIALTKSLKGKKPTVFTGMPWSGSWYVPGAKSFQAQLFKDAGAEYLWLDNDEKASLVKSKEIIIDEAYEADFWLNLNSYSTISSVTDFDDKFIGFSSVKKHQLYNNNNRLNDGGGNDYWESGVINPHVVLKDLIKVFHPNLIEHEFYYYQKLN